MNHWRAKRNKKLEARGAGVTKPGRIFKPATRQCYKCSMPGVHHCEVAGCGMPMCTKHRVRKAGGNLCAKHEHAVLVQHEAQPQTRFRDPGEAVPHAAEPVS